MTKGTGVFSPAENLADRLKTGLGHFNKTFNAKMKNEER
jgi:hypothetical protein